MRRLLLFCIGLSLAAGLVAWQGVDTVIGALSGGGWWLLWLVPYYLLPLVLETLAWQNLVISRRCAFGRLFCITWIGMAINTLLPVAALGGEIVRARLAMQCGVAGADAGASVVADKTIQAMTIMLYGLVGLILLVIFKGGGSVALPVLASSLMLTAGIVAFYRLQRKGLFGMIARLAGRLAPANGFIQIVGSAEALDAAIQGVYERRSRVLRAMLWRVAYRIAMTGELGLILYLLGHPLGVVEVVILHSLGLAIRAAAFVIPGGLGVQEGGYLILGATLGLSPEAALAASLARRFREVVVNVPGLIGWQVLEARALRRDG